MKIICPVMLALVFSVGYWTAVYNGVSPQIALAVTAGVGTFSYLLGALDSVLSGKDVVR